MNSKNAIIRSSGSYEMRRKSHSIFVSPLFLMALSYGLLSSSTPDGVGLGEILVFIFLIYFVVSSLKYFYLVDKLIVSIFAVGVVVGVFNSILQLNPIESILRDLIPFLYIFIPCITFAIFRRFDEQALILGLFSIGVLFSLRYFSIDEVSISGISKQVFFGDLNYYPLDPAVTFGATYGLLQGSDMLLRKKLFGALYLTGGIVCYLSLAGVLLRAPLVIVPFIFVLYYLLYGTNTIRLALFPLGLIALFFLFGETIDNISSLIMAKTETVGFNQKDQEIVEVFGIVYDSGVYESIFGLGFGSSYFSSATESVTRFSHSFFAYSYLKLGFIGLLLYFILLYSSFVKPVLVVYKDKNRIHGDKIKIILSCLASLVSCFFLQASYKSLTFALLVTLAILFVMKCSNSRENRL